MRVPSFYTKKDGTRVTRKRREDATVFTEVVLELDPMFMREEGLTEKEYENMTEAEFHAQPASLEHASPERVDEAKRLLQMMIDEVVEDYGKENVVGVFWHWDETNPYVQMIGVSVADKGSLSYSSKFGVNGNKTALRKKYSERHDRMRTKLREAGYDATFERVSTGKARDLRTYKRDGDLREQECHMEAVKTALAAERQALDAGAAKGRAEGQKELAKQIERLRKEWTTLRGLEGNLDDAIREAKATKAPTSEQARTMMQETVRSDPPHLIYAFLTNRDMRLKEQGKKPGWVKAFERFAEQRLGKN